MTRIVVPFPVSAGRAFAFLADPRNRPAWQSSLRAVADVLPADGDATAAGTTWTDLTVVPGVRPRMRTTQAVPGVHWQEDGRCGLFRARLDLWFSPADGGCQVVAEFRVRGLAVGLPLTVASRPAIAADLRRAASLA
ncbi:SRPBCC family protein [Nocardioides sp. J54]|uniref:SRPBCC family protein n=1 Tax=Nocardioides sp. J54 TaxID=935866 RepID=UPI00048D20FD|nr:SRPBCC family protein [Nocardioides sp. J54]